MSLMGIEKRKETGAHTLSLLQTDSWGGGDMDLPVSYKKSGGSGPSGELKLECWGVSVTGEGV